LIPQDIFSGNPAISKLRDSLCSNSKEDILLKGVVDSARSFTVASVLCSSAAKVHLFILDSKDEAAGVCSDLYSLWSKDDVFYFPSVRSQMAKVKDVRGASSKVQRGAAISALISGEKGRTIILVTWPAALQERIKSEEELEKSILKISKGNTLSHDFIKEVLLGSGFTKVDFVTQPGEFALRGSLVDVFSYGNDMPYRIDFFGDSVESLHTFNYDTQRSIEPLESVEILPDVTDNDNTSNCRYVSLFDLLPSDTLVWIDKPESISEFNQLPFRKIYFNSSDNTPSSINTIEFHTSAQPAFNKNFELLNRDISSMIEQGWRVFISSSNPKQFERLRSIFSSISGTDGTNLSYSNRFEELQFSIAGGFVEKDTHLCIYTDHQIFQKYNRVRLQREVAPSQRMTINELNSLSIGDYIVHIDHGVGVFGGLVKTNVNGKVQEAIKIIYKDNDVVLVSIHGIHRISRYKSKDGTPPRIFKLGSGAWEKLKSTAKSKVKDIAKELIDLYARRRASKGFAYSADSFLQSALEASFMFEDTPDQIKATAAIKADMERDYPMDRLVCGDVGFGKTEVAIRAAFKAVADNKQVAVLVPTTILALQHYQTFTSRLKGFPCRIEYVSRLRTTKEIKDILEKLKSGKIDIIIGTHRLLNKEVSFKDLGLLIIDEEQKFGVSAKERLKSLKLNVDTLTLTATPIPRTLQFSLLGARDLSIINTPPPNRQPVHTEIINFDEDFIREAVVNEIERGGQVYFIHNKVEDIESIAAIISRLVPNARLCVGHGQMEPKILEQKMLDFISGDYDVLIATTIIENGIDVPNANTMIVNGAQNFGLSDLHQLRGRVGRSNTKAYCYLIVPSMMAVSDDARRRLRAIEAFSDLGSGFNIAMQDLDIRGAGNLLGGEQSGFIADMGFETYQKILNEALVEMKEESVEVKESVNYVTDCTIDTDLELLIPDSYVNSVAEKIRLYKELDAMSSEQEVEAFIKEMEDRFGPVPEQLFQLTFIVRLRREAISLGFEKVVLKGGIMLVYFPKNQNNPYYQTPMFSKMLNYINANPTRFRARAESDKFYLRIERVNSVEKAFDVVSQIKKGVSL